MRTFLGVICREHDNSTFVITLQIEVTWKQLRVVPFVWTKR